MTVLRTPGVYIAEHNPFPNSIVEPATSVAAFVGWTERAELNGKSVHATPVRISSLGEFQQYFGGGPLAEHVRFSLSLESVATTLGETRAALAARDAVPFVIGADTYRLTQTSEKYNLYFSMLQFFESGGSDCYVVSVGRYGEALSAAPMIAAIEVLAKEAEPTILVVPEAVMLSQAECYRVQTQMISHCAKMRNRFAVLDVWEGYRDSVDAFDAVAQFRSGITSSDCAFAAAYYPWLNIALVRPNDFSVRNLDGASRRVLAACISNEMTASGVTGSRRTETEKLIEASVVVADAEKAVPIDKALANISSVFNALREELAHRVNLQPPAAAMAGVFAFVDYTEGVWRAPANVALNLAISPAVAITDLEQGPLNASVDGKSINAIRSFVGRGTIVWGARTLDGNSADWRYISVRRTCSMIETAVALAMKSLVFEPNSAATWTTLRAMISNYLTTLWQRGALAGSKPEEAFNVQIGVGESMTEQDVTDGIMRATMMVSVSRPSEFIVITVSQQLAQK